MRDRYRLANLRDVLARRELEQEAAIVRVPPLALTMCRTGCGTTVPEKDGHDTCSRCRRRGLRPPDPLPEIEPIAVEVFMPAEKRVCARPGCKKSLRSDNTKGVCSVRKACGGVDADLDEEVTRAAAADKPYEVEVVRRTAPPPMKRKSSAAGASLTLERFRLLTEALGLDADELLAQFAEGWLDKAREAVRPRESETGEVPP